jgi:hypothetical protein
MLLTDDGGGSPGWADDVQDSSLMHFVAEAIYHQYMRTF